MVRPNELSFARRGALAKLADRARGARPGHLVGRFVGLDEDDDHRAVVAFGESEVSVLSGPHKLVPGSLVAVEVDSTNAPTRITGPVTTRPEGLDADIPAPAAVTTMPELGPRELTAAEAQAIQDTADNLAQAQQDLVDAVARIGEIGSRVGWAGRVDGYDGHWVDWAALGDGQVRLSLRNDAGPVDETWLIYGPGIEGEVFNNQSTIVVTADGLGFIHFEMTEMGYVSGSIEILAGMLEPGSPLTEAVAEAARAAEVASRIAPRSTRDPVVADGADRPVGAVWTKVNAAGEELAYWAWDGSTWVPQALARQVIPLLDAAHISTGVLDSDRINVTEIWGEIATFGKIITQDLIATGAVTAEALNVVYTDPESGYGFSLQPEGLTILDESGSPVIALRADMTNYFTIMRDGAVVASISPNGDIAGRSVSVAENLRYQGEELSELLEIPARGVLARSTNLGNAIAIVGTSAARIAAVSLTTPTTNRNIEIRFEGRLSQGTAERRILFNVRQSANPYVRPTNTSVKDWYKTAKGNDEIVLSFTTTTEELDWPSGTLISLGVFAESVSGETLTFHQTGRQQLIVKDLGPAVKPQSHKPFVPASGGGTPTGTMDEHLWREQVSRKKASWVQTYRLDGTKYVHMLNGSDVAQRRAWQGYANAPSGVIGFPSMVAELSGATIKRVRLRITNVQTHRPEGATARISLHGYTSRPATHSWSADVPIMEVPFSRGESQVIDIPAQYHAGVQAGLYRGVVFSASGLGTQYSGVWDGENALWEVIYEK